MSRSQSHPRIRRIDLVGVETPLLVPSFSSRGFPEVNAIFQGLRNDLYGVCLVSAFDISTRCLTVDLKDIADIVLLDSGVYETKPIAVAADGYHPSPAKHQWDRDACRSCLGIVGPEVNVVAVSFDHYGPVEEQIDLAIVDFACAPTAARDFLLKPGSNDHLIDTEALSRSVGRLAGMHVLGVTEIELGDSLLQRCRAIVALRESLSAASLDIPIHVFGSITPGAVLSYFLCGADIFDGLNWLRFAYGVLGLRPMSEAALEDREWDKPDGARFFSQSLRNLRFLRRLQDQMRSYCRTGDMTAFAAAFPIVDKAQDVASAAGAVFSRKRVG